MGAIYGVAIPSTNASRAPGTWQRFRIDFRAPRFDASGKKTKNARFLKIELNGQVVQQNAEAKGVTPGGVSGREAATGPLMFQGNHGPVAYRNIVITPLGKAQATSLAIPKTDEGLPGTGTIRRYGWFQKLWLRKREAWAVSVAADQNALVFLGDSITQGWGDKMGNSFPGVKVANRGISGDTTRGMLVRLESDVLALNPSGVVMLMGTNDLEEKATAESIAGNVRLIIDRLEAHNPKMPIILCKVFPSSASKRRSAKDIRRINKLIAAAVNGDARMRRATRRRRSFPISSTPTRMATRSGPRPCDRSSRPTGSSKRNQRRSSPRRGSRVCSTARTSRAGAFGKRRRSRRERPSMERPAVRAGGTSRRTVGWW
jgi:hypothetical protein